IFQAVKKGDLVVDIGTGTGILAFFALQAGAEKVYAIESGPFIEVAKKTARENGLIDRIEFIRKDSREAEIPEPADLLITETIGSLGIDESIADILADGRKRFLKQGGKIIPAGLSVRAVPVSIKGLHPFHFLESPVCEIDFSHLKRLAINNIYNLHFSSLDHPILLSRTTKIQTLDLYECRPMKFPVKMHTDFTITQKGTLHGTLVFPEITLAEDISISFLKDNRFLPTHWGITFFPVSNNVELSPGDIVSFDLTFSEKNGLIWQNCIDQNGGHS
ncbi:MAG: 50S ribosomal protein L11 methyltransferase, partial [Deltaproteobacteria bacterium]|nr:50S ribosomal protein L11 methyltransferase [Deltaproteobacteria bacterium]